MPIFVERFVLPLFAAIVILLAVTNPMGFDRTQRITGTIAIIFLAYFCAHTIYKANRASATPDDLEVRAQTLSQEILGFLAERNSDELRKTPRAETWVEDVNESIAYSQRTMDKYSQRYAARVISIRNELSERGIRDRDLDMYYEHPTNPIGIRKVGERLGALAEKLKRP